MKPKVIIVAIGVGVLMVVGLAVTATLLLRLDPEPTTGWGGVETRRAFSLDVRDDHVVVSEREPEQAPVELFSFSLLVGVHPTLSQSEDGVVMATFEEPNNGTVATASFSPGDPNVWIHVERKPSTLPREVGKGWLRMPSDELVELLGFGDNGVTNITEPQWISSWTFDPVARLSSARVVTTLSMTPIHQLAPDPQNGRLVWSYPRVDADCDGEQPTSVTGRLVIGETPLFKMSATNHGRLRTVATIFSLPSSGEYAPLDEDDFGKRIDVLRNGHTNKEDPRYGNGGLGFANVDTTIFSETYTFDDDRWGFASSISTQCPKEFSASLLDVEGEGVRLFSNGSAGVIVPEARPFSAFASGAFKEPRAGILDVYHVELAASRNPLVEQPKGALLKTDGEHWTLSDFATKRLGDIELLNDGEEVEFIGALEAADRVRYRDYVELRWLPNGNLELKAKEFAEEGFTLLFHGDQAVTAQDDVELKSRTQESTTAVWWDFDSTNAYELTFPGSLPISAIDWSVPVEP